MSIPWNILKDTTGFINEHLIKPTAEFTAAQSTYLLHAWMKLPAALNPVISPTGSAQPHNPAKWTAQNVLGQGGFGIASLWRYNDPGHKYHNLHVVLKIGTNKHGEKNMQVEGAIMNSLSSRMSEHLVSMVYVDQDFKKLYLEWCPDGDLFDLIKKMSRERARTTEEEVWRLLLCLTKAAFAMHQYAPTSIIHYDLKPDNILIQPYPPLHSCGEEHKLYKIGDFGLASENDRASTVGTIAHANRQGVRGTPSYWAPEMFDLNALNNKRRKKATLEEILLAEMDWEAECGLTPKLDIWGIGAIVWEYMVNEGERAAGLFEQRLEGKENIYLCPPNRFNSGGKSYGRKILSSGYSSELINIVQWCLMKHPSNRCSAEELFPHVEAGVRAITAQLTEREAREARVEEARKRAAGNAPSIAEASLATVEERVQEELKRIRAARAAKRAQRLGGEPRPAQLAVHEPLATTNTEPSGNIYEQRMKQFLEYSGRKKEYFDQLRSRISVAERNRLIDAFLFMEGDSEAWLEYVNLGGDIRGNPGSDQDGIVTYQMMLEDTPQELTRCLMDYMRRVETTHSTATRMQIVIRQRRYEGTPEYRQKLLDAFQERFKDQPDFMRAYSDLAKMRVQRATESYLPIKDRPLNSPVLTKAERQILFRAFQDKMEDAQVMSEFERIMKREGRSEGDWMTDAIDLQLQYLQL